MANNGDIEANELTQLVDNNVDSPITSDNQSPGTTESDRFSVDEMEEPWPATFERSISLLASPIINPKDADRFTKSPKPGYTPISRRELKGHETPDGTHVLPPLTHRKSMEPAKGIGKQEMDYKATIENLKSQAKSKLVPLEDTQKKQAEKAKEAAEYRAKILAKAEIQDPHMSPGFHRESATLKKTRAYKKAASDRKPVTDGKATSAQSAFNLANILMGVGLLGLPYACSRAGTLGGLFAIVSFGFITWKTSIMIGRELNGDPRPASYFDDSPWKTPLPPGSVPQARMRKPISSFPAIAREAFGNVGAVLLSVVLYFELFSCICIFIVSIGDHLHTLFPTIPVITHQIGCAIFSAIPIILLRTAKLLSYLSMVGTFATVAVVGSVVVNALAEGDISERVAAKLTDPPPPPYHILWDPEGLAVAFGLVAYCFSGHAIIPSIYSSMEKPQDFERVVDLSFGIVMIACIAVGLSGYHMFGSLVFDQITISLEQNSSAALAMTILTYLMILTAFSKLTLTMFPLAIGMEEIVAPFLSSEETMAVVSVLIKVTLLLLALLVAIFVPSFSFLCSMVGMICTMAVSVIFPAAAFLKLFGPKLSFCEKLMYWGFVIAGIVMAVVGTIFGL